MTKKKIIIHAGTHKTGTTSIQMFMSHNKEKLSDILHYPDTGTPAVQSVSYGHHLIPWILKKEEWLLTSRNFLGRYYEKTEAIFPKLTKEIEQASAKVALISSEEFSLLTKEQLIDLRDYLSEFDLQIILYFRRKDQYIESCYQTRVVNGGEKCLIDRYLETDRFSYSLMLTKFFEVFGKENVTVKLFSKTALKGSNIITDIIQELDLPEDSLSKVDIRANQSLPLYYVELITRLRRLGESEKVCQKFIELGKKLTAKTPKNQISNYHILSKEERFKLARQGVQEISQVSDFGESQLEDAFALDSLEGEATSSMSLAECVIRDIEVSLSNKIEIVDFLRDEAIKIEKSDLRKSFILMSAAKLLRPQGPRIIEKMKFYSQYYAIKRSKSLAAMIDSLKALKSLGKLPR